MKRLVFLAEPLDPTQASWSWVVMAHNLDDAGDVEQVAGPFPNEAEANTEAERFQRNGEAPR
jgi:hypothetical protein